jgi:phenylpropionate dioxygenase-like ring-hydroxylating dioxygenase large terminal subunit
LDPRQPDAQQPDPIRHFHPVLSARDLRGAPVRVELAGRRYVLFRDGTGQAAALVDRCPHRFAPLSAGKVRPDGRLACPYHGWNFDAQGHCDIPSRATLAKCDIPAFQVVERAGYLWLAAPSTPLSALPRMEFEGYTLAGHFSMPFEAPLHVAIDNFSEDEHTPYVHTRLGWDEPSFGGVEYECRNLEDRSEIHYRAPQRWTFAQHFLPIRRGDFFHNDWVTRFDPVRTEYNLHWTDAAGNARPLWIKAPIYMVPETPRLTRFHVFTYLKLTDRRLAAFTPLLGKVLTQMVRHEIAADARFIPTVADTPFELNGMKLGRFDKPLAHQRKLLKAIYWGQATEEAQTQAG